MAVIVVHGLAELKQALKEMSDKAPRELTKANRRVGALVAKEAKRLAPKGLHEGGGTVISIASSIHATASADRASIVAGGSKSPQAAGAEFGGYIPRRGFKGKKAYAKKLTLFYGGKTVTHLKKQPYLLPAIEAKLGEVVVAYQEALDSIVAKLRSG